MEEPQKLKHSMGAPREGDGAKGMGRRYRRKAVDRSVLGKLDESL